MREQVFVGKFRESNSRIFDLITSPKLVICSYQFIKSCGNYLIGKGIGKKDGG